MQLLATIVRSHYGVIIIMSICQYVNRRLIPDNKCSQNILISICRSEVLALIDSCESYATIADIKQESRFVCQRLTNRACVHFAARQPNNHNDEFDDSSNQPPVIKK